MPRYYPARRGPSTKPLLGTRVNMAHPLARLLHFAAFANEGMGKVLNDASPGAALLSSSVALTWGSGPYGITLQGSGVSMSAAAVTPDISGDYSFGLITTPLAATQSSFASIGGFTPTGGMFVYDTGGTKLQLRINNAATDLGNYVMGTVQQDLFFVVSRSAATIKVYVNAVLKATISATVAATSNLQMGPFFAAYSGTFDRILVYKRALDATEVAWLNREPFVLASPDGVRTFYPAIVPPSVPTATGFILSGPASLQYGVASTFTIALTPLGAQVVSADSFSLSDGGRGGIFSATPISMPTNVAGASITFTYTPSVLGGITITATDTQGLGGSPSSLLLTSSAPVVFGGTASTVSTTETQVQVSATAPAGGVAPLTKQLLRSLVSADTGGTVMGGNGLSLTDTPGAPAGGGPWYYRQKVTDALGQVAYGPQTAAVLQAPPGNVVVVCAGDSITYNVQSGVSTPITLGQYLQELAGVRVVACLNQGANGSSTQDWLPAGSFLAAALNAGDAAATAAGTNPQKYLNLMLGTNDCRVPILRTPTDYKTNLQAIITYAVGRGYKVVLHYPPYTQPGSTIAGTTNWTEADMARAQGYQAQIDSLVDNVTVFPGSKDTYNYFAVHGAAGNETNEGIHPNVKGMYSVGLMWALAYIKAWTRQAALSLPNSGSGSRKVW